MEKILTYTHSLFAGMGATGTLLKFLTAGSLIVISVIVLWMLYMLLSRLLEPVIYKITRKTEITWDDIVFRHNMLRWVWVLVVCLIGYIVLPSSLAEYPTASAWVTNVVRIMLILTVMMLVIEGVKTLFLLLGEGEKVEEIVRQMHEAVDQEREFVYTPSHSLKGLQQMIVIVVIGISMVLIASTLLGKDPVMVFSGLSALAAVLMLVFQDSILGMVAGVQITANDMLQPGDWIVAPKYGANGIVKEVTLAAVKVQNWDKTIVTVPPYRLLTEGFQNWRGMLLSKGRRVMRSINIDLDTVRFATEQEVEEWSDKEWWCQQDPQKRVANLTAFRMYLEYYISQVASLNQNMLYMVRELQPTGEGIPVEIYFFTSMTSWKSYEMVQADVVDYVLALLPEFGLRAFQHPTGHIGGHTH